MMVGKNSKLIKNWFFIVTNNVTQEGFKIQHKGTEEMWADVNTKPLQGMKFRVMRG